MSILTIEFKGIDNVGSVVNNINQEMTNLSQTTNHATESGGGFFSGMLQTAGGFLAANVVGGITSQFSNLVGGMISGNAEFEKYTTQFGVLLGGADAAKERLAQLSAFGASTPFELPELVQADKVLQTFGLHSQEMLTTVGDVAAGTGQSFQDIALYMGKFSAGATGEALARFQELGIVTKDELGKMGVEFNNAGSMTTPVAEAMPILEQIMKDKFGGMMDAQSKTFEGMTSNLQDWAGQATRTLGAPIFDAVKDKLADLLTFLGDPATMAALNSLATTLADGVGVAMSYLTDTVIPNLISAWQYIQPLLQATGQEVDALAGIWQALQPAISNTVNAVGALVNAVFGQIQEFIRAHGDDIAATMTDAWQRIQVIIKLGIQLYNEIVPPVLQVIAAFLRDHGAQIQQILGNTWNSIKALIDGALTLIEGVIRIALDLIHGDWQQAWADLQTMSARLVLDLWTIIKGGLDNIAALFGSTFEAVKTSFMNFVTNTVPTFGRSVIDGIISGINDGIGALEDAITGAAKRALDAAKKALGISSPSRVFADQVGFHIATGIAAGINHGAPQIQNALSAATAPSGNISIGAITSNVYAAPSQSPTQTAAAAVRALNRQIGMRRA